MDKFESLKKEYDEWAISVYTTEDEELGYVTRFKNETIARLMDHGKKFIAVIDEPSEQTEKNKAAITENMNLPFSIYMED